MATAGDAPLHGRHQGSGPLSQAGRRSSHRAGRGFTGSRSALALSAVPSHTARQGVVVPRLPPAGKWPADGRPSAPLSGDGVTRASGGLAIPATSAAIPTSARRRHSAPVAPADRAWLSTRSRRAPTIPPSPRGAPSRAPADSPGLPVGLRRVGSAVASGAPAARARQFPADRPSGCDEPGLAPSQVHGNPAPPSGEPAYRGAIAPAHGTRDRGAAARRGRLAGRRQARCAKRTAPHERGYEERRTNREQSYVFLRFSRTHSPDSATPVPRGPRSVACICRRPGDAPGRLPGLRPQAARGGGRAGVAGHHGDLEAQPCRERRSRCATPRVARGPARRG